MLLVARDTPDHRQRAPRLGRRLRALGVLDRVRARAVLVVQRQQARHVDLLPARVEHVRRARRRQRDPERRAAIREEYDAVADATREEFTANLGICIQSIVLRP